MSYQIDLTNLLIEQLKLDTTIQENHHVTYPQTRHKRLLALLVELGEFANTTRCFKFWSNKGKDEDERVLDEAADCLHFYLGLHLTATDSQCVNDPKGNIVTFKTKDESFVVDNEFVTALFLQASKDALDGKLFESLDKFFQIIDCLGYSWSDLEKAYYKKLGVNYVRQETNY